MSKTGESKARHWSFTVNNPTKEDCDVVTKLEMVAEALRAQHERGESGTLHIQGYVRWPQQWSFSKTKKLLPKGAHIQVAQNPPALWDYCSKEESKVTNKPEWTFGKKPESATAGLKGSRWELYKQRTLDDNGNMRPFGELIEEFPDLVRYEAAMLKLWQRKFDVNAEMPPPEVIVIWGPPGTGKSHTVREMLKEDKKPFYHLRSEWWAGYTPDIPNLWIDDFQPGGKFNRASLFNLMETGRITAEVKGGHIMTNVRKIFITSNFDPATWFEAEEKRGGMKKDEYGLALRRRITKELKTKVLYGTDPLTGEEYIQGSTYEQLDRPVAPALISVPADRINCASNTGGRTVDSPQTSMLDFLLQRAPPTEDKAPSAPAQAAAKRQAHAVDIQDAQLPEVSLPVLQLPAEYTHLLIHRLCSSRPSTLPLLATSKATTMTTGLDPTQSQLSQTGKNT